MTMKVPVLPTPALQWTIVGPGRKSYETLMVLHRRWKLHIHVLQQVKLS